MFDLLVSYLKQFFRIFLILAYYTDRLVYFLSNFKAGLNQRDREDPLYLSGLH